MEMKKSLFVFFIVAICFLSSGCLFRTYKKWWNYSANWKSNDNTIFLYDKTNDNRGQQLQLRSEESTVTYDVASTNDGTKIKLYRVGDTHGSNYVMIAESKIKDGQLYLTFTFDQTHGLEGKTIILEKIDETAIPQ